jgi:hypothetical protein
MHILHASLVDQYFEGALGAGELRRVFDRIWRCGKCRRRYERHLLFERVRPQGGEPATDRLWRSIAASAGIPGPATENRSARPAGRRRAPGLLVLATALAGAAAILVPLYPRLPTTPTRTEPVARGPLDQPAAPPSVHLYRTRGGKSAPVEGELHSDDGVLVAYSNPSTDLGFLMVFGVDSRGGIHWYYPGYEHLGENPAAVPIRTGALGVELGEEVRHDLPVGELRMFSLFLPQPRHVLEIESLVARRLAARGGSVRDLSSLELPEGVEASTLLEVRP